MSWAIVRCPECGRSIGRIFIGLAEHGCRRCKIRVESASDGKTVTQSLVDRLPAKVET
jgi:uncharacterized protein (DUF983 family)